MELNNVDIEEAILPINDAPSENTLVSSSYGRKIVTNNYVYEKYDKNLNNRPDYDCYRTIDGFFCLICVVFGIESIFIIIMLCLPEMNVKDYRNAKIISTVIIIVSLIMLTLVPYSIKYTISCSNRQLTYQYITIIPTIFLLKKFIVNIDDAVYFREDFKFAVVKLMKMNKNNEEVVLIRFVSLSSNAIDTKKRAIFKAQKMARLLNEIIGFDINLVKKIKNAYINKDNDLLKRISDEMDPNKKALYQNLFAKMEVDIKL